MSNAASTEPRATSADRGTDAGASEAPPTPSGRRWMAWLYLLPPVLVPLAVFFGRLTGGGYSSDDWSNLALSEFTPAGPSFDAFLDNPFAYRSLVMLYARFNGWLLGEGVVEHMIYMLVSIAILGVLVAVLLRRLGAPFWLASTIATLGAIYPYSSITKIWFTAHLGHTSIAIVLVGILIALRGLQATGPVRQAAIHAAAMVFFLISLLFYELTLPLILGAGLFYLWNVGREVHARGDRLLDRPWATYRSALLPWAADVAMVLIWRAQLTTLQFAAAEFDLVERLKLLGGDGAKTFAGGFIPFLSAETDPWGDPLYSGAWFTTNQTVIVCAMVLGLAALSIGLGTWRSERFGDARLWGVGVLVAIVAGFAGWLAIIPANDWYRPVPGDPAALRVNVLASFGLAAGVVCTIAAFASIVARRGAVRTGVMAVLILFIVASYTRHNRSEVALYNRADQKAEQTLENMRAALPADPVDGTAVLLSDNANILPGRAEVFNVSWSFPSALRLTYDNPTLMGVFHKPDEVIECRADGVAPYRVSFWIDQGLDKIAEYGKTFIVSTEQRRAWPVTDRKSCRGAVREAGLTLRTKDMTDLGPFGQPGS